MSLLSRLPHSGQCQRQRRTADGVGGDRLAFEAFGSAVSCWVQPASQREIVEFQKRDMAVSHKVYFTADPQLQPGDQLVMADVTANQFYRGKTFDFMSIDEASAGTGILIKAFFDQERSKPGAL